MHYHARLRSILALSVLFFVACAPQAPAGEREHVTALRGTITSAGGTPLAGVSASAGTVHATSDANGEYDLHVTSGAQVVTFELAGYVRSFERVTVVADSPTQLDVTLLPMAAAIMLDASLGGTVTGARGASIVAPAMAFVDPSGAAVTGMVAVHLTPIDPSMGPELAASPGDFTGDMAGTSVPLESLGMMDITVESGGARLQVAPGATLQIHIPVAAGASSPDAQVPLWSFDEVTGVWADEGMAALDASHGTYVATTHHMSIWNCDQPYLATCVCGTVVERGAGPLPGARVDAEGLDYFGASEATTDASGRFCLAVRKSSRVSVAAYHASGGGTSREVTTGAADTNVPPTPGDARCVDIGTFEVARDVFTTPMGTTSCTDTSNPFSDACGRGLWTAFSCLQASGACTIHTDTTTGGNTITYANGARRVTTISGTTSRTDSYDPSGALCMTQTVGTDSVIHLTSSAGAMFTMSFPEGASGDLIIGCPDGSMQTVSVAQRQAIQACSPNGGSSSSTCTVEGGGTTGSPCTASSQCTTSGDVCCAISGAPMSYCIPSGSCP